MLAFLVKNKDDIIYLLLLLFSIVVGRWFNRIRDVWIKKWTGTLMGLILIIIVSGYNSFHPIFSALLGITIIKLSTVRYCHVATFVIMFGYLFFFRLADNFGLPLSSGQTNLIEMIIVLRVVGVAFEINGSWVSLSKPKKTDDAQELKVKDDDFVEIINPMPMDLFHYSYNYIGLLTGPYYRYRTFDDYFKLSFSRYAPCTEFTLYTLKNVPLYVTLYLVLSTIWPLEYVLSEEHNCSSFLYKMIYPWFVFTAFRFRIYSGMTLSECVCTSAGLGAYPVDSKNKPGHGPTVGYLKLKETLVLFLSYLGDYGVIIIVDSYKMAPLFSVLQPNSTTLIMAFILNAVQVLMLAQCVLGTSHAIDVSDVISTTYGFYHCDIVVHYYSKTPAQAEVTQVDFITIECMDVWGCETVVTLRESTKTWNKCVQYWVGMYIYKRFPINILKVHVAFFVSVIWHGFHAGYFFCIYFCPFYLMAEDIYYKLFYKNATGMKKKIIGFIMWFLRLHSKSYQGVAFLLLSFERVWRYYTSVYHYFYWVWFTFLIIGFVLMQLHKSGNLKTNNELQAEKLEKKAQ